LLLELDDADKPDDAFTPFNLGWTLMDLGKRAEALPRLQRARERSSPDSSILRKLYHLIALAHRLLNQRDEALAVCRDGLKLFPDDTELTFEEALLLMDKKDFAGVEADLLRLVETRPGPYFASVDDGMRGFKTRHLLACHYREQRQEGEAEVQWRAALAERANITPAWLALGELFVGQHRWADVEWGAKGLEEQAKAPVEAAMLRGQASLARKEFAAARGLFEGAIAGAPEAPVPWVLLSHALLQEGRDWAAAERALRKVLQLDPGNLEAHNNLAVLLRRQERVA
jgi:tetratricopeptide (TPR) repeat protein